MNTKTIGTQPKTDEEYKQEIDRMIPEIEAMLKNAGEMSEQARKIGESNRRRLDALEKRYGFGEVQQRERAQQELLRESELRESKLRVLRLERQLNEIYKDQASCQ